MVEEFDALHFLQATMRSLPASEQLNFVVERVAKASSCVVVVFDSQGDVLASIGDVAARMFWEVAQEARPDTSGQVGRWNLRIRRSGPSGGVFTMVLASRESKYVHDIDALVDAADIAITAVLGTIRGTDVRRARDNARLLETLISGIPQAREHRYWPRLVEFGFASHTPFLVTVSESLSGPAPSSDRIAQVLDDAAADGVPLLIATQLIAASSDSVIHSIIPDSPAARTWQRKYGQTAAIGVSQPHSALADVPIAVREAEHAQRVALARIGARRRANETDVSGGEFVDYRSLRLTDWVTVETPQPAFRARRRELLSYFDGFDLILDTVITYLAVGLNVPQTAEILFLHTNTVRYRLARAEDLLDAKLSDPFTVAELVLALSSEIVVRREAIEHGRR